jgi:hypothetical protein
MPHGRLSTALAIAVEALRLFFLQTVQHQLHPSRHTQLIEDVEQIVSNDSGSTVLGFTLASLALCPAGSNSRYLNPLGFLLFAAALPVLDLAFAVTRRAGAGRSPFFGDRRHLYDLLGGHGYSPRHIALACYAATALLATLGWLSLRTRGATVAFASALILALLAWAGVRLGALRTSEEPRKITTTEKFQLNRAGNNSV